MQDYLKVIWTTQEWDDSPVTSRALAERFGVSPSTVSEALKKLAAAGLVDHERYGTATLTDAGRAEAEASADRPAPWETPGQRDGGRMSALPKAGFALAQAVGQVGRTGTPEQVQSAVEILDEARRRVYALLAQG